MNITHHLAITSLALAAFSANSLAQSNFAEFVDSETTLCYEGKNILIDIPVRVTLADANELFTIKYDNGGQHESVVVSNNEVVNGVYKIKRSVGLPSGKNHTEEVCRLTSISSQKRGETPLEGEYLIKIFAVPQPEILTPISVCGLVTELIANDKWSDISTYAWAVNDGSLSNANSAVADLSVAKQLTLTATLTETTGGKCVSSVSKDITLRQTPIGTLTLADPTMTDSVLVCSSRDDEKLVDFGARLTLDGNSPFDVTLSNDAEFKQLTLGNTDINLVGQKTETVVIREITDRYGCHTFAADRIGAIKVKDRKPRPKAPIDTATYQNNKDIAISVALTEPHNSYELSAADEIADYNIGYTYHTAGSLSVKTNMNGRHRFFFTETNNDGKACSATIEIAIDVQSVAEAPSGFSPNGDGINDCLVISGLPERNHLSVVDAQGKLVFEKENYRNDWSADDLPDGYYTYVVEGTNMKTFKETLVIKRTK